MVVLSNTFHAKRVLSSEIHNTQLDICSTPTKIVTGLRFYYSAPAVPWPKHFLSFLYPALMPGKQLPRYEGRRYDVFFTLSPPPDASNHVTALRFPPYKSIHTMHCYVHFILSSLYRQFGMAVESSQYCLLTVFLLGETALTTHLLIYS